MKGVDEFRQLQDIFHSTNPVGGISATASEELLCERALETASDENNQGYVRVFFCNNIHTEGRGTAGAALAGVVAVPRLRLVAYVLNSRETYEVQYIGESARVAQVLFDPTFTTKLENESASSFRGAGKERESGRAAA